MVYFLNINIGRQITGIEHAAIRRLKLFKSNNTDTKIVTAQFNYDLHENIRRYGLHSRDILNMYDFFQDAVDYEETAPETIESLCRKTHCHYTQINENDYKVYDQNEKYMMYAHCVENSNKLNYVNYFDTGVKKVRRDFYDVRGFKSQERYLGDDQKNIHEIYYKPDGAVAIHKYYGQYSQEKSDVTLIELNYNDEIRLFRSEEDMVTFFLDCIARTADDSTNILISDKARIYVNAMVKMTEKTVKIAVIHNKHKFEEKDGPRINSNYRPIVENIKSLSAVVILTEEQKRDFELDFGAETPIFVIPSGFSQQKKPRMADKIQKNKVINVARFDEQKRLDHLILAFDKIKDNFPDAELHLYGFGSAVETKLRMIVNDNGLNEKVFFRGYLNDLDPEYSTADLFVLSSLYEGLPLVLLEAISYGIPIVSYDIKYGPSDLIKDGISGYLVKSGDIDALAAKMSSLLSNESQKKEFGIQAREIATHFSEAAVWEKWRLLIERG
jgi:poly(glycerol-phosphate) alpha-glucosyltransferase